MSKGHCGHAHLVANDETLLLYSYCAYDINRADWQEIKKKEDGEIAIDRDSLIEPEVHEKVKNEKFLMRICFKQKRSESRMQAEHGISAKPALMK